MRLPHRAYLATEVVAGQAEIGDLEVFARAVGADPIGVIIAILCGAPEIAEQSRENMLMLIACLEFADLLKALGPHIGNVKPYRVLTAVSVLKRLLQREVELVDRSEDWLDQRFRRRPLEHQTDQLDPAEPDEP